MKGADDDVNAIANAEAMTHQLPEAQALADKMSNAWIAFAKTEKTPEWKRCFVLKA
jgi:carboxylesterase type B